MTLALSRLLLLTAGLDSLVVLAQQSQKVLNFQPETIAPSLRSSHKIRGRFLHITDFHPDEFYRTHASTAKGIACHRKSGAAGVYGAETSDCDSPISLVNATFDWISENLDGNLDFVIWTGDSARHDSDERIPRTKGQVIGTNKLLASKFAETFIDGMKIPVIPTFGNNDILPHNILLPGPNEWLGEYAKVWHRFIPEEQKHLFEHGGWFYVEVVPKKLAVFSLNTLYFFDRNAAVDDCVRQSEPGFQQMEWLTVQLNQLRERGMKAILMGHVPPARTDSKQNWDETCWQKYTLWLRQYRDIVVGAFYGHMNIDHFFLQDTKHIDFRKMTVDWAETHADISRDDALSTETKFNVQSASDYLHDLRSGWSKFPNPAAKTSVKSLGLENDEEEREMEIEAGSKTQKKGKANKNLGGKWAERYQVSFVSPSVVPNYFPTLRVVEYDMTGLGDHPTWAHALENPALFSSVGDGDLLNLNNADNDQEEPMFDLSTRNKKKKGKKGGHKVPEPNFRVPDPPPKNSPPGPAYSRQPFTLTGYTQYFANLTWINNDMTALGEDHVGPSRWHEGIHHDKDPKREKAKPNEFEFEIEYSTFDDKMYKLKDLTVRNMIKLAYRIGQEKSKNSGKSKAVGMGWDDEEFVEGWGYDNSDDESNSEAGSHHEEVEARGNKRKQHKKKHKKKKKKKKRKRSTNEVWLAFLWRALVSTVPKEKLGTFGVEAAPFPEEL